MNKSSEFQGIQQKANAIPGKCRDRVFHSFDSQFFAGISTFWNVGIFVNVDLSVNDYRSTYHSFAGKQISPRLEQIQF